MRNEVRIGRLRGAGATVSLTGSYQVIPGLSTTLDVPKGCVALVFLTVSVVTASNYIAAYIEVDGVVTPPAAYQSGVAQLMGETTIELSPGRHALRVVANASTVAGTLDPYSCTLSWIIAPRGGQA